MGVSATHHALPMDRIKMEILTWDNLHVGQRDDKRMIEMSC